LELADAGSDAGVDAADDDAGLPPACIANNDCGGDLCSPGVCLAGQCSYLPAPSCDDGDECTTDSCDPKSGQCMHQPVTLDLDGDGYNAPRPGYALGAPGSCGNDCDDTSAAAHPGGLEICDGVDNDCDGVIDNGATYSAQPGSQRVSSAALDLANTAGLAFDGNIYGASYTGNHSNKSDAFFQGLSEAGGVVVPELSTRSINSDTYAGGLLYNGQYFGTSWPDARQDGSYEIYFNRLDSNGKKLGPDLRVTDAPKFSLNPALAWNGTEFLDVWDDRRFDDGTSSDIRIFGQRITVDGTLVGGNVQLTQPGVVAEYPAIAVGKSKVGIVFSSSVGNDVHATFITTDPDFSNPSSPVDLGAGNVQAPRIAFANGVFVVVWGEYTSGPGNTIQGAVVNEQSGVQVSARAVTSTVQLGTSVRFAADPAVVSLGDRVMLVWAADLNGHYDLYQQVLSTDLSTGGVTLVSDSGADARSPAVSFGPNGDVGVLFDDWRTGNQQTYFAHMTCAIALPCPCK
jgi:hypothetical protein